MSGEAHTPRPWKVLIDPNDEWPKIVAGSNTGKIIANVNPESFCFGVAELVDMPAEANARLIAAAPDLLAALKEAIKIVPLGSTKVAEWVPRAMNAIDKAEGKK
jgi:hypothetical protein